MKKQIIIVVSLIFTAILQASAASANDLNVQYPVKELGNCSNKIECKQYCDKSENVSACLQFAKKNQLMDAQEIKKAEKFIALGNKSPGGCSTKNDCDKYCDDMNHIKECLAFAQQNNLLSAAELEETKKVMAAIDKGITPPACHGKEECDIYCNESNHMEECINFSIAAGIMPADEAQDAQKMLNALKKGAKAPNCRGKEECDSYCRAEEHLKECRDFAIAAGFMNAEEAAQSEKTGGKGPGDCRGKEECENFCKDPANQETCSKFVQENGLLSEQDKKMIQEGQQKLQQAIAQAPAEVITCLTEKISAAEVEKIKNGTIVPSKKIDDTMGQCFQKTNPQTPNIPNNPNIPDNTNNPQNSPQNPTGGPGRCKTKEECEAFCYNPNNQQTCMQWDQAHGMAPSQPNQMPAPDQYGNPNAIPQQEMNQPMLQQYQSNQQNPAPSIPAEFQNLSQPPMPQSQPQPQQTPPPATILPISIFYPNGFLLSSLINAFTLLLNR